jgi:putative hydrolase of the HAD superfamily
MSRSAGRTIQAVVFDLDDTLINWAEPTVTREEYYWPGIERIYFRLADQGLSLPAIGAFWQLIDQAIVRAWDDAKISGRIQPFATIVDQILSDLGVAPGKIEGEELLGLFDWGPRPGVIPFPDTFKVLNQLRAQGYLLGLLTNSFLPMWIRDAELEAYDLLHYWDARITAADVGYVKPHPVIYQAILNRLQIMPHQAVFVGDRPRNDIAGANNVGMISVLISPGHLDRELEDVQPDYRINSLIELLRILEELG